MGAGTGTQVLSTSSTHSTPEPLSEVPHAEIYANALRSFVKILLGLKQNVYQARSPSQYFSGISMEAVNLSAFEKVKLISFLVIEKSIIAD